MNAKLTAAFTTAALVAVSAVSPRIAVAQTGPVAIVVDAAARRHAINPNVYGVNWASSAQMADLNFTVNRRGGTPTSSYNWRLNADNRGNDWYFESLPYDDDSLAGEYHSFISATKAAGAEAMVTVPTLGRIANLGLNRERRASFSVRKYGAQQKADPNWRDAGNGVRPDGSRVQDNDPNDASVPNSPAYQADFVRNLVGTFGPASAGGVRYYGLDNEPGIWHETHRDVQPVGVTMEEERDTIVAYADAVRSVDPDAVILGPIEWGWSGYFYSGYDQQYASSHDWCCYPDREAHGDVELSAWLLGELRRHDQAAGRRSIDVFALNYYPQSGEFWSGDTSAQMQLLRNRSTRSLWDANYHDVSWIDDNPRLIPRMKEWVANNYPGLQTGLTEYDWGADNHINGATTEADLLGIFGREGIDLALKWNTPAASTPTYKAMKLFRNYDGRRSTFGNTSVSATAPNPDEVSAFAAERSSDGALTVMVVCKALSGSRTAQVSLRNFAAGSTAEVYQLTAANQIVRLADVAVTNGAVSQAIPAQSVTLLVIRKNGVGQTPIAATVISPNGGERLRVGRTTTVSWSASGPVVRQEVRLSSDGGQTFPVVLASVDGTKRSFAWTIPATQVRRTTYRIQVVAYAADGRSASDASDQNFRISR